MTKSLVVLSISFIFNVIFCQESGPIVQTRYGALEGKVYNASRGKRSYFAFCGIQYAVVQARFKPSIPPIPWNNTKPAFDFGNACWNITKRGDENCLFLNVYTPQLTSKDLPVVVYIHGGSFQGGSANNYGPNYLMDEDVVLVTINYRLGILGFLSTEDENSPGNYGLKDQVMAFRWIQDNIGAFGGDKNKVTIMGQSAGSASVTYHLVSPMSKGLFRFAIAQSGTFLDPWAFTRKPLRYTKKVAKLLNCTDTDTTTAIIQCLRAVPSEVIGNRDLIDSATVKFLHDPLAAFGPTIEPIVGDGSEVFLSVSPYELLASGNFNKVPLLTGVVKEEGVYIWAGPMLLLPNEVAVTNRQNLEANWSMVVPQAFYFDERVPRDRLQEISDKIQAFYFKSNFSLGDNSTLTQLSHLYSDRLFVASFLQFVNLYSKHAPTYPYLYTFNRYIQSELGWFLKQFLQYNFDATHAAELDMLFSPLFTNVHNSSEGEFHKVSKSVVKLWTSFINNGTPSATYGSQRNFPRVDSMLGVKHLYQLDADTKLSDNIFSERVAFWKGLNLSDLDFTKCYC